MSGRHHDEGHTIAGRTGTAVTTAGSVVTGLGLVGRRPGLWAGPVVVAPAALVTWGLHLAGWGKGPGIRGVKQRGVRIRDLSARAGHPNRLGCRLAGRRGDAVRAAGAPADVPAEAPAS
ncbi:HGxxPAAW family protein [Streptomyces sp. enrichment culture]|uniref:HGxxPAAW family protein n=1 Tax=Streptomyces sp. enrichment culture TaxID=1795815 RepID=UPI003F55D15A